MAGEDDQVPRADDAAREAFGNARSSITESKTSIAAAYKVLGPLLAEVTHARSRGRINELRWTCEKMLGGRPHHFSQAGQDAYLDEHVFNGKRDGVFIEIGGYDGITGSNCLFFEMMRGWSGLLIEPSPTYHAQAAAFRRATCLQIAVADQAGEAEFLEVLEGYTQMSGLASTYDEGLRTQVEGNPRHKGETIRVKTHTLPEILDQHALRNVDYISLDVEGGEMAVLEKFPFERYQVAAWTVENNTAQSDVPNLMQSKGYRRIEALGVDDVYVRAE